jgi:putative NADPH-quinone reductase/HAMP domain-containing protein
MLIIHAHPRPSQSRVVKQLLGVLAAQPGAELRSLYELYPDFDIDVEAEQQALLRWQKIVWLTPVHWYSVPAMMKHWIDQVLALGWAYGHGGEALRGKTCWWVCSAGGTDPAYALREMHRRPFQDYVPPVEQTARFLRHAVVVALCGARCPRHHRARVAASQCHPSTTVRGIFDRSPARRRSAMNQAILFLGAALVFVPLAVRLGLGSVLGYLLAGVVIGPMALGLVSDPQALLHVSELGVVLMLFVIGLELEPKRLWAMRGMVFGGGTAQMAVCAAAVGSVGWALGWTWQASLIGALALALSSTAIVVALLQERNLMPAPLGRHGFSMLLYQDMAAIPLLALAAVLGQAAPPSASPAAAASVAWWWQLGAVAAVVLLGRYVAYPVMHFVARMQVRELFTGFALRFARSIVRPVRALTQAAAALKEGQYDAAGVEVKRRDELGQLGRTFNVMIDVLRQRDRERRRDGG